MAGIKKAPKGGLNCCSFCNGKLTRFAGFRRSVDSDSGERPTRLYWIACQACQKPVPPHHPLQVELDREMAARTTRAAENVEVLKRLAALETEVSILKTAIQTARKR